MITLTPPSHNFLKPQPSKPALVMTVVMAVIYFLLLIFFFQRGNMILFAMLAAGEIFHLWQVFGFAYTVWDTSYEEPKDEHFSAPVDIFITVAGEPVDIVEKTAQAALDMNYPGANIYLLNDGYVAKKENWKDIESLAKKLGIHCITRKTPGGAKAGNINNALKKTRSPFVAIFDADQVPHQDFLEKMIPYFANAKVGFVQSPQYYKNAELNEVSEGAWQQQELFFGPICMGKARLNSTFMCGTNMVLRRETLMEVGGMCEHNIAEDFLTSLFIHERGWKSVYVPEVLAEGLAPEDFLSYYKQQFRWARGSLEVVFRYNPLFRKGLSWPQKIQYLSSASFFLSGIVIVMNALLPLLFFFFGLIPLQISTMLLATVFLPYIILTIYVLQLSSNFSFTFKALAFSMSSFTIHIKALMAVVLNKKSGFDVTAKKGIQGNFTNLVIPHMIYLGLTAAGVGAAVWREGLSASMMSNLAWAFFNAAVFVPFISAALPSGNPQEEYQILPAVPSALPSMSDILPPAVPSPLSRPFIQRSVRDIATRPINPSDKY